MCVYLSPVSECGFVIEREREGESLCMCVSTHACVSERDRERENVYVVCCILVGTACEKLCVCVHIWVAYTSYHFATS